MNCDVFAIFIYVYLYQHIYILCWNARRWRETKFLRSADVVHVRLPVYLVWIVLSVISSCHSRCLCTCSIQIRTVAHVLGIIFSPSHSLICFFLLFFFFLCGFFLFCFLCVFLLVFCQIFGKSCRCRSAPANGLLSRDTQVNLPVEEVHSSGLEGCMYLLVLDYNVDWRLGHNGGADTSAFDQIQDWTTAMVMRTVWLLAGHMVGLWKGIIT